MMTMIMMMMVMDIILIIFIVLFSSNNPAYNVLHAVYTPPTVLRAARDDVTTAQHVRSVSMQR